MARSRWIVGVLCLLLVACAGMRHEPAAPPTVDVTGRWSGTYLGSTGSGIMSLTLQQTPDGQVTGAIDISGAPTFSGAVTGTVSKDTLDYRGPGGIASELTVVGNQMNGYSRFGNRIQLQRY